MPSPYIRKTTRAALERARKYQDTSSSGHPYRLFPSIREDTKKLRKLLDTRNYIKIATQVDDNRYIIAQYYIYCEEDTWLCGDGLVFNCNPDKKILVQPMCSKSRRECPVYHEGSREFMTVCAQCSHISLAIKDTLWVCPECKFSIPYNHINDVPFLKLNCKLCPIACGWDKVRMICSSDPKVFKSFLEVRSTVICRQVSNQMEDMQNEQT